MPELRDYQKAARDFLQGVPRSALYLDMGLGKTATTLHALSDAHLPALVIAPPRVAREVWPEEVEIWRPDLKIVVAGDTPARRAAAYESRADIVTVSRDSLRELLKYRDRFRTVILDESSGFKSHDSTRFKTVRKVLVPLDRMPHVWELTGTPTPNGLLDLWAPTYLLDAGKRLGTGITRYRHRYFYPKNRLPSGVITEWAPYPETPEKIHALLSDIALSMDYEVLPAEQRPEVLPPNFVTVPMDSKTRAVYAKLKKDLIVGVEMLGGVYTAANAAVLSSRLSQVTAGFLYEDDHSGRYQVLHTNKVRAVEEIVEGTGGPVVVFYRFRAEWEMMKKVFKDKMHGVDTPQLQARWNAGELPILAAHPASLGHGLNLHKGPGHTAAWTTLPWSLEEWQQANRRLARPGQAAPVVTHILETPRTVDRSVARVLAGKRGAQDALLEHLESPL